MEFKFDSEQEFQIEAINAIVDLFDGQPPIGADIQFIKGQSTLGTVNNRLDLTDEEIMKNLNMIQERNGLTKDSKLDRLGDKIKTITGMKTIEFYNFSVEMETGTGKTYVYVRTMMELFKKYGYRKFIVVVPSVAVREGVMKTLEMTKSHIQSIYENVPYQFYPYDSGNLTQIRQFTASNSIQIMVMTIAAFNKDSNIINRSTDRLQGETPIHLIQAARPILILDEPQNMESQISVSAIAALSPICALRYSATHRNPYNVVYRLTPWEAFRQGLVKRIEVASIVREDDELTPYIHLNSIETKSKIITAKIWYHHLSKSGIVEETKSACRAGVSLVEKSKRPEYEGFTIDEINVTTQTVRFSNGIEIKVGEEIGSNKEAIFEGQIEYTIEEHFRKQRRLKEQKIKVVSLFFIDRVDNYVNTDSIIRTTFNKVFNKLKMNYKEWSQLDPEEVQAGYFAKQVKRDGTIQFQESTSGETPKDKEVYDLIMKNKERLISFDEKVSFIFSHSALREGWDNPNVFQICTLNQTVSEMKKRQEVGRGIRLCVDQTGQRNMDERNNVLTVIANESYELFVQQLQSEIADEYKDEIEKRFGKSLSKLTPEERRLIEEQYGKGILPPKPENARRRATAKLRKEYKLKPEFKELWNRIKYKTRYSVHIDSEMLVKGVVDALNKEKIRKPRVVATKALVYLDNGKDSFEAMQMSSAKTIVDLSGRYPLPDLIQKVKFMMENTTPPIHLTRNTILNIFTNCSEDIKNAAMDNPHEYATVATRIIRAQLANQLVDGIEYEKINEWYEMTEFVTDIESWEDILIPTEKSLYDNVKYDSGVERDFIEGLENRKDVRMYVKLPGWFKVQTPIGNYNPDWAIIMDNLDEHGGVVDNKPLLYLVRETKGTTNIEELQHDSERQKVKCASVHFNKALGVDYRIIKEANDLP